MLFILYYKLGMYNYYNSVKVSHCSCTYEYKIKFTIVNCSIMIDVYIIDNIVTVT